MACRPIVRAILGALVFSSSIYGATFIVPDDRQLITDADAIVTGRVLFALPQYDSNGDIVTQVHLVVDRALKGPVVPDASITIYTPGGVIGDEGLKVTYAPAYWLNGYVLAFLEERDGGYWITHGQVLGKFEMVDYFGEKLLVRGLPEEDIFGWDYYGNPHTEVPRMAGAFVTYIEEVVAGDDPAPQYFYDSTSRRRPASPANAVSGANELLIEPQSHVPASSYLMMSSGQAFRWNRFDSGGSVQYRVSGSQPGYDSIGVAQRALAGWTNDPGSNIHLQYVGTSGAGFVQNGENTIVYNSSTGVPSGAIGYSRIYSSGTHVFRGQTFWTIGEGDVVIKSGLSISATAFEEAVAHEVGHSIGFRHSNEGTPSASNAVMNSIVSGQHGSNLQAWDREAANHVYPATTTPTPTPTPVPCIPASIASQPAGRSISPGQSAVLSVVASGTAPITYQWYFGASGNTSSPVPGGGGAVLTVSPSTTTSYWVRVSNACGSVNSVTAVVTVSTTTAPTGAKGDFNGDGRSDLVWRNRLVGENLIWFMSGGTVAGSTWLSSVQDTTWAIKGAGDFNGDGYSDLLWRNSRSGENLIWFMRGTAVVSTGLMPTVTDMTWEIAGSGDFDGDGLTDIVWRNSRSGENLIWFMSGVVVTRSTLISTVSDATWQIAAGGDLSGDGRADLIWRNRVSGEILVWQMNGATIVGSTRIGTIPDTTWTIVGAGDFDGNGHVDLAWRNVASGENLIWAMSRFTPLGSAAFSPVSDMSWNIAGPR